MLLLQFSTSHYCRKARLALGYKGLDYQVENLTPGLHALKLKPMTGLTTVPVLLPQQSGQPEVIADSTRIFHFLDTYQPDPPLVDPKHSAEIWALEDWLDESIGIAARFVYYDFRAGEGKSIDPSLSSQAVIQVVRWQYGINEARVALAKERLECAVTLLSERWKNQGCLVGDSTTEHRLSAADLAAAALLSPLALIPTYRKSYPGLFERIVEIHKICQEPPPPGLLE
jgi:glutathione S-transferase